MSRIIPDRWIPYKSCGTIIEGTRIICFKVPLRKAVQNGNPKIKEIWDIPTLLKKIPKLGAVIDLTNTSKYYDPREFQAAGVLYKKILTPGHEVPPENKVIDFMDAVDEFMGINCVAVRVKRARRGLTTAEAVLGVHCTHGLNRTGYMVCRYLRDRLNVPAKLAIKRFEIARGYQIERDNYVADLMGKSSQTKDVGKNVTIKPVEEQDHVSCEKVENPFSDKHDLSNKSKTGKKGYHAGRSRNKIYKKNGRKNSEKDSSRKDRSYDYRYDY